MLNTVFPTWPSYSRDEADAVSRVLLSNKVNYWTGEECRKFEKEFAECTGCSYAISLSNGTLALEVALRALEIKDGDEVIVTPRTFIASASSIVGCGGVPVFADVDRDSQNITAETISRVLSKKTRGIICVHLAGMPCDMNPIMRLANQNKLFVIEDCAQAHGGQYKGHPLGSIGDIGAWSFCQDKIMTTGGEGGMVTTNNSELWSKIWSYKDHGKSWNAVYSRKQTSLFRWVHDSFGSNYRMMEMQAVLGRIQLHHLAEWKKKRQINLASIMSFAKTIPGLRVPVIPEWADHAAYKCYVFVEPNVLKKNWSRDRIITEIYDLGVPCYSGTCSEIYLEKAFDYTGWQPAERLPAARELGETSMMFLVHPTLTNVHIEKTCKVLKHVMELAVLSRL
ncbi:MAG: DegT/DnrJ/EryC1/StrS aminotransferase family protein [Chlorobiaceae bacterium]